MAMLLVIALKESPVGASKLLAAAVYLATTHPYWCLGMALVWCLLGAVASTIVYSRST